jgi:hypothetical protein
MISHTNYSAEQNDAGPALNRRLRRIDQQFAARRRAEQIAHLKAILNHTGSYMRTIFSPGNSVHSHGSKASVAARNSKERYITEPSFSLSKSISGCRKRKGYVNLLEDI